MRRIAQRIRSGAFCGVFALGGSLWLFGLAVLIAPIPFEEKKPLMMGLCTLLLDVVHALGYCTFVTFGAVAWCLCILMLLESLRETKRHPRSASVVRAQTAALWIAGREEEAVRHAEGRREEDAHGAQDDGDERRYVAREEERRGPHSFPSPRGRAFVLQTAEVSPTMLLRKRRGYSHEEEECAICLQRCADSCLDPCDHRVCGVCARRLVGEAWNCPFCRTKIESAIVRLLQPTEEDEPPALVRCNAGL